VLKRQAHDADFIRIHTEGFDKFSAELNGLDPSLSHGMSDHEIGRAVDLLEGRKVTFVIGNGVLKQMRALQVIDALLNLCLLTGSAGQKDGGILAVLAENNVMGAWDMGAAPDVLPGNGPVTDGGARKKWERSWGIKLSPDPGLDILKMVEEAEKGNLKALYIMGENPLRSLPDHERVRAAFERVEFVVLQDILENETSHVAHVLLPGAPFSEKDGSFTNMEGRVQVFHQAVPTRGKAMADWEILDLLGAKMGYPSRYGSLQSIRSEIARFVPLYKGMGKPETYLEKERERIKNVRAPEEGHRIPFCPVVPHQGPSVDREYPFTALIGTTRYHSGGGTRTSLSGRILDFGLKGEIELSPFDGDRLGLKKGVRIKMKSRQDSIVREVRFNKGLKQGLAFVPQGFYGNDAMKLISLERPLEGDGDDFKQCSVRIEKA
jgi:formate dehydrogenase alpha subunit